MYRAVAAAAPGLAAIYPPVLQSNDWYFVNIIKEVGHRHLILGIDVNLV